MRKNNYFLFTLIFVLLFGSVGTANATVYTNQHSTSYHNNHNYRGIKGGFKIPNINSNWQNNNGTFITFEQWMTVNNSNDWFEMGYMDGAMDPEHDGIQYDYRGCFKAKNINGVYTEATLSKTVSVGARYAFEISDTNADNIWYIFINGTSYGAFSNSVPSVDAAKNYMGYEYKGGNGSTPVFGATDINSQYYRSQGQWRAWNNGNIYVGIEDDLNYVNAIWNPNGNSTSFNLQ